MLDVGSILGVFLCVLVAGLVVNVRCLARVEDDVVSLDVVGVELQVVLG